MRRISPAGLFLLACSSSPELPPCDPATLAAIVAECATRVETECASRGVAEADCEVLTECDARLNARLEACR